MLTQICQSAKAWRTYLHLNSSAWATLCCVWPRGGAAADSTAPSVLSFRLRVWPWYLRRKTTNLRSSSDRNVAVSGKSCRAKKAASATITVAIPSRMKIHRHPSSPPTPSILEMANASRPEKAPATDAALKNSACRSWISVRTYHMVR